MGRDPPYIARETPIEENPIQIKIRYKKQKSETNLDCTEIVLQSTANPIILCRLLGSVDHASRPTVMFNFQVFWEVNRAADRPLFLLFQTCMLCTCDRPHCSFSAFQLSLKTLSTFYLLIFSQIFSISVKIS